MDDEPVDEEIEMEVDSLLDHSLQGVPLDDYLTEEDDWGKINSGEDALPALSLPDEEFEESKM